MCFSLGGFALVLQSRRRRAGTRSSRTSRRPDTRLAAAHAAPEDLDRGDRRVQNEDERPIAGIEMGEVADLVDEHRAAVAAQLLVGPEHEM